MSKSSSRLTRPGSAGSNSPSLRKGLQGNRSCMLRIGERLMRAGSEGNLVQKPIPAQNHSKNQASIAELGNISNVETLARTLKDKPTEHAGNNSSKDPGNSPSRVSSSTSSTAVDHGTQHLLQKKQLSNSSLLCNSDFSCGPAPRSPSTLPRGNALTASTSSWDSQLDSLMMKHSDVERKREVFLDHLRQKYPHHASIIMGQQDCMRKQAGSPQPSDIPPRVGVLGLAEQKDALASEAMSDGEGLPPTVPFTRGCKARASLPVGWSRGQTREKPLGVLYLQYGEETKQVRMPAEISSQDDLRALFVTAFPHQLTMKMLQSPNMAIYIKDPSRNIYYDLEDIRNITSHSCLKAYHKDPTHVFNRHARPAKTEGKISKEDLYSSHSPVHTLSSSNRSTLHSMQGSICPPMVRSMPSSPSRMAYGGGSTDGGVGLVNLGSATLPRERLSVAGRSNALCTNSSAILERRDVKPDEDAASSKSTAIVVHGEGGLHFPDSYCSSLQDGRGGRLSIASQCSAPPSLITDMVDSGVTGIPGGLPQYRASIKPLMGYREGMENQIRSLHRQKSRKYGDSLPPPLGTKSPPTSPHRVNEVRMIDRQILGGMGPLSPERISPIHRSLWRDSNGATVEIVNRSRESGSSSSTSSVFVDSPLGRPEKLCQGHVTVSNAQSERMKAMEEQIASLAGLVHNALSMGPHIPGVNDAVSETAGRKVFNNRPGAACEPQNSLDSFSPAPPALQDPPSDSRLQQSLVFAKRSVCELRLQLNQLRHFQLSNQESVNLMLRMAGQELVKLLCDRLAQSEEAAYRRRTGMEEERIHYLTREEKILTQLSELEDYVKRWQRSSASSPGQLSVTLRDVEEGAVNLRRVGEAVAILKGEFLELQVKMQSLLRLEVEAVRFLKEEPHKIDSMLKRVKALTEALSSLRRCVSQSTPPARWGLVDEAQVEPLKVLETDLGPLKTKTPQSSPKPQPRSSVRPLSEVSLVGPASPFMAGRVKSTAATVIQPSHHHSSPPLTPTHGRDSPSVAKVSPCSREGSPALQKRPSPLQSNGLCSSAGGTGQPAQTPTRDSHTEQTTTKHNREAHTESVEETQTAVGSLSVETSTSQANHPASSDSSHPPWPNSKTDFDQVLQETHGSPMKSDSDLNEADTREGHPDSATGQITLQVSAKQQTLLSDTQEDTPPKLSDEVDSTLLKSTETAPPSAPPSTEHSSRPQVEKPHCSSLDKEMKQSPNRVGKSSPAPPPRSFHAVSSGLTTGRSGEVIFTTRKEPVGAQDNVEKERELPVVPQPKPPRQPPEVKPKSQMCARAPPIGSSPTTFTDSAHRDDKKEEEEDNKFMTELQVTTEQSNKINFPGGNQQWKREVRTSPTPQVANQNPSELVTSDHQLAPQLGIYKLITAVGLEEHSGAGKDSVSPDKKKEPEAKVVKQVPSLNCATVEKMEVPPPVALQDVQTVRKNDDEMNKEVVGKVFAPTTAEKKVTFTTLVTLQKKNIQVADVTNPDHKNEIAVKETPAEEKSKVMVVVTLQKENADYLTESSPTFQYDKSPSSDHECIASIPDLKLSPLSSSLTYSHDRKQENREATVQVYRDQSQYTEEGGSLSPDIWDNEGPPPPLPSTGTDKIRISKTRVRTQPKEEDLTKMNGFDMQTVGGDRADDPTSLAHENQDFENSDDFDKNPVIVILNEPMGIHLAYKRLSTIFECEENLEGILSPADIVDEVGRKQEEHEQDSKICIAEINLGQGLKDITGNGQNSLHMQQQRPSADNGSIPENQDREKPDSPRKTETKRKFKFKFPKNKLAAISQAIRTGTTKTGKKTPEGVVNKQEEEMALYDRPVKETKKQTKRFEINSTKQFNSCEDNTCDRDIKAGQVDELCKSAFDSADSLEESIKQLEISVDSRTATPSHFSIEFSTPQSADSSFDSIDRAQLKGKVKQERDRSPSKRPASQILKGPNPPQSKRAKAQPPHNTEKASTKKQTSNINSSSSTPRSHTKSRNSSPSFSPEKTLKGQKQASQRQPSQPHPAAIPR